MNGMQKDIFISYRREDGYLFAHVLAKELTERGYSVFFDRADIVVGTPFPKELTKAIEDCNDFISLITPMYLNAQKENVRRVTMEDDWVRREISLALSGGKQILPIIINTDPAQAFDDLPDDIADIASRNFISYDPESVIEEFVSLLEKGFSDITIKNRGYNALLKELSQVSDENDNDFNVKIRNLILNYHEDVIDHKLLPLIENREVEEDVCFAAYYAAFTFYRRLGYVYKIHKLVDRFGQRFMGYRFNNIVLSQHYSFLFELDGRHPEDLHNAIHYAQAAIERIPSNAGVLQNYADLITKSFELGVNRDTKQLDYAIDRIYGALQLNPNYPKYHCTLGRLLSFRGEYSKAVVSIQKAISLENMETKDSFVRIVEYNKHIYEVKLRQMEKKLMRILRIAVCGGVAFGLLCLSLIFLFL